MDVPLMELRLPMVPDFRNKGWDSIDTWETSSGVRNITAAHDNWNGTVPSVQHSCAIVNGQGCNSIEF